MPQGVSIHRRIVTSSVSEEKRRRRMARFWTLVTVLVLFVVFSEVPGSKFCALPGGAREGRVIRFRALRHTAIVCLWLSSEC